MLVSANKSIFCHKNAEVMALVPANIKSCHNFDHSRFFEIRKSLI